MNLIDVCEAAHMKPTGLHQMIFDIHRTIQPLEETISRLFPPIEFTESQATRGLKTQQLPVGF